MNNMFAKSNKKLSVDSMAYLLIKQCEVGFVGRERYKVCLGLIKIIKTYYHLAKQLQGFESFVVL